jgi:acyl-CoA thioester hydrolase
MSGIDTAIDWDLADPFILTIQVQPEDVDRLGHANNVVYVRWLEEVSWAHIESLGMTWERHEATGRAMAITRTEIDYLAAANQGEQLLMGTWLVDFDGRFRSSRRFQLVCPVRGKTLVRAVSTHACVDLKTQRPARVPKEYRELLGGAVVKS